MDRDIKAKDVKAKGKSKKAKVRTGSRLIIKAFILPFAFLLLPFAFFTSCTLKASRSGIPPEAQNAIDSITNDMAAGRFEKIYEEAADEWQRTTTPQKSNEFFQTLKAKLGNVKNRSYNSATEQHATSGNLPGHSFVITYQTTFERGEGMETFTMLERDGRWLLAGYFVNSNALTP